MTPQGKNSKYSFKEQGIALKIWKDETGRQVEKSFENGSQLEHALYS
jgi:hypothetical protein